jgi:hypothetical protein
MDAIERLFVQSSEQCDAPAQALGELDAAPHRVASDFRHLLADAVNVRKLVDALDGDQRRVHVHREQAEIRKPRLAGNKREVKPAIVAIARNRQMALRAAQAHRAWREPRGL